MANLLYFYGTCGLLKELLLQRYFSKVSVFEWDPHTSSVLFLNAALLFPAYSMRRKPGWSSQI